MNTPRPKVVSSLSFGALLIIAIFLLTASTQSSSAAPMSISVSLTLQGNTASDYDFTETSMLVGRVTDNNENGLELPFELKVQEVQTGLPETDPQEEDHLNEILSSGTTDENGYAEYTLNTNFFDADDVGTWTIRFSVVNGSETVYADLNIIIDGFGFNEKRPNAAERNVTQASVGCIQPDSYDSYMILEADVPGVIYSNDEGNREDYRMQAPLVALLEHLVPLANEDEIIVRISDAWDSDCSGHGTNSTHYEGRGLDITSRYPPQNNQEIRRLSLRVQEAIEGAGFRLFLDPQHQAESDVWIFAEPAGYSNPPRRPGEDHVHVSIKGQHYEPYTWGSRCEHDLCLPHRYTSSGEYSGAAVGAMILNWQGWSINEYEFHKHSGTPEWEPITCEMLAKTLNKHIDRGWTCVRTGSRDEALRTAAFWIDTTAYLKDWRGYAFPVAIPMKMNSLDENYIHWVAVDGAIATADPSTQGSFQNPGNGSYTVGALNVIDPSVSPFPPQDQFVRRFVTKYELEGNYQHMESEVLPNLGITYAPTGPGNTYELVVPAGCRKKVINNAINVLTAASTSGVDLYCDLQYSIASPPAGSTVSTKHDVRVITMVPNNIGIPWLKVTEIINADGDEGFSTNLMNPTQVITTPEFYGSSVWEFVWRPPDPYIPKYRLTVVDPLNTEESCGSVEVIPSGDPDDIYPEVYFLQPFNPDGKPIIIENRHPYSIQIRTLDNQGVQITNNKDNVKVSIQGRSINETLLDYEYCGPACYQFNWDLNDAGKWPDGRYDLTASATDVAGNTQVSYSVTVGVGQGDPVHIDYLSLQEGQVVENNHKITIIASGGLDRLKADLIISGPDPDKIEGIYVDPGVEEELLDWIPLEDGQYTVTVIVYDALKTSNKWTEVRKVRVQRNDIIWDGEWEKLSPTTSPKVKNAAMADTGGGVYLFGGQRISGGSYSNKLWKWDGSNWIDQTPPSPSTWPEARTYPQLTYDSNRGRLVLFGGIKPDGTFLRDVWEYIISTGNWVERTKYPIPHFTKWPYPSYLNTWVLGRGTTRMSYDALHNQSLLVNSYSFLWDSLIGDWTQIDAPDWEFASVAYDSGRDIVVLYTPVSSPQVHEWDGSQWQAIPIPSGALSPVLKQAKLISSPFGVYLIGSEASTKELWLWDGNVWTRIHASRGKPPKTNYNNASVAYDSAKNQLVVYTTNGQTWVYSSKLENLTATPTLFKDVWPPNSNYKLGPGMQLTFRPHPHPNVAAYETQFSEDGGATWQACTMCGYSLNGSVQHHGVFNPKGCGHGYYYCLKREQSYSYRVRPLNQTGQPMLDWTYVFNTVSFDWPARVEIEAQTPGPYQNGETVTLNLKNSYGQGMKVDWIINAWGGAASTVEEGCGSGQYYKYLISQTCTLTISYQTAFEMQGVTKLAKLEPTTSVDVIVKGTDVWNNESFSNKITLNFQSDDDPPRIINVEPMLYTREYEPGKKYGPGMRLDWIHSPHPEMVFYEIQFSEDGGKTWQIYMSARDAQYDWVNHHGNFHCEHGFYRCLKRNQDYHYRIRALDFEETPITDWSNVVSATSMEWPAHVELDTLNPPGNPPGYYPNSATVEIKINPQETFGKNLELSWQIIPFNTATYTILDNTCAPGTLQNSKATTCKLRIYRGSSSAYQSEGASKLAALEPVPSVKVIVKGEHTLKDQDNIEVYFSAWDDVYLYFQQGGDPDTTFSDAPEEHWAYPDTTSMTMVSSLGVRLRENPRFAPGIQ